MEEYEMTTQELIEVLTEIDAQGEGLILFSNFGRLDTPSSLTTYQKNNKDDINEIYIELQIFENTDECSEVEKTILENTEKIWRYIARDNYGHIRLFTHKPERNTSIGWWDSGEYSEYNFSAYNHLFKFIKWENEPIEFRNNKGEFLL